MYEFKRVDINSSEFLNLLAMAEKLEGKVFGIMWNRTDDILQAQGINVWDEDKTPTKRQVLKVIAKIFDPLGFGKVFIQDLWREGLTWDEPLPEMLSNEWSSVLQKLKAIPQLKVPRLLIM